MLSTQKDTVGSCDKICIYIYKIVENQREREWSRRDDHENGDDDEDESVYIYPLMNIHEKCRWSPLYHEREDQDGGG